MFLSGCGPNVEQITSAQLDGRLKAGTNDAPGIVFGAVWRDGKTVLRAAGKADLRTGRAVTPATPFAWFSLTKLFTATAVMQLSERGRIDLDAPVGTYLPETTLRRGGREATVRELLSHTAGLPNPIPVTWVHLAGERGPTLNKMIRWHVGANPKLDAVPGTQSAYSNLGYLLLGRIVERVSNTSYESYVEANVLAPLGCTASGFATPADRATGYQTR